MLIKNLIIFSKLGMNLLKNITLPKNDQTSFLFLGMSTFELKQPCLDQF